MTYKEWHEEHQKKKNSILDKISNLNDEQKVEYFRFEKMVKNEPNFCLLYKEPKKCHDLEYLNCLCCDCPYFEFDDERLPQKSSCTINSLDSAIFEWEGVKHLDCSNCTIPHSKEFAMQFLKKISS